MRSFSRIETERLASALLRGLRLELFLTPKPGLVDLFDAGSHFDLSLPKMLASIDLVGNYFAEFTTALARQAPLEELVGIGRHTEGRLFARLGTNTHKGSVFLGGLLLIASFRAGNRENDLSPAVAAAAAEFFARFPPVSTHGASIRRRRCFTGIVGEALAGLPTLFDEALPAYRETLARTGDHHLAAFAMLARLMRSVEDTTAIHRCGLAGLVRVQRDGAELETTVRNGEDPFPLLLRLNREYRRMNLTMGGVADLLGMGFGLLDCQGSLALNPTAAPGSRRPAFPSSSPTFSLPG